MNQQRDIKCPHCGAGRAIFRAPKRFVLPILLLVLGLWGLFRFEEWTRIELFAEIACFGLSGLGFLAVMGLPYTCRACKKPFTR